jgi:hypothetical protein
MIVFDIIKEHKAPRNAVFHTELNVLQWWAPLIFPIAAVHNDLAAFHQPS